MATSSMPFTKRQRVQSSTLTPLDKTVWQTFKQIELVDDFGLS
jgi:hypothetical protein